MITIGFTLWKPLTVCLAILIHLSFHPPISVTLAHTSRFSFFVHVHRFGIYGEQESDMWQGYEGTLRAAAIHAFLSMTSTDICPSQGFLIHPSFQPPVSVIGPYLKLFVFRSCSLVGYPRRTGVLSFRAQNFLPFAKDVPSWYCRRCGHFLVSNDRSLTSPQAQES